LLGGDELDAIARHLSPRAPPHLQILQRAVEPFPVLSEALLAVLGIAVDLDHLRL